jgi:hypothetical protein
MKLRHELRLGSQLIPKQEKGGLSKYIFSTLIRFKLLTEDAEEYMIRRNKFIKP